MVTSLSERRYNRGFLVGGNAHGKFVSNSSDFHREESLVDLPRFLSVNEQPDFQDIVGSYEVYVWDSINVSGLRYFFWRFEHLKDEREILLSILRLNPQ